MNEYQKNKIIQDLESKIGSNVNELRAVYAIEDNLINRRDYLQSSLSSASNQVPSKLSVAIVNAEKNSKQVEKLKDKSEKLQIRIKQFLDKTGPWRNELSVRLAAICKYEGILLYLKAFEKVDDLSAQLKQCVDDEQAVMLYSELKGMCAKHSKGHQASYIREYTHYWHNVLKDKLTKEYEDLLKLLKWPFTTAQEHSPPPKEVLTKFGSLTWYLLLIEEPKECLSSVSGDFSQEQDPCLPVRILLRPLKKRFLFHFTGSRQTARIDRPEWFLTQTLTWIKDHQGFIKKYMEPVVYKHVKRKKAENEFNEGLVSFAAERLHTVLGLYQTQSQKGEIIDVDAAFAHAVDETLGFHKELVQFTGKDSSTVLSVLTKAETFIKWLAVEKKYALAKMDETLGSEQWMEAVCSGTVADSGAASWVPRGSDWLVTLLKTIEDRYAVLPQPGHRLQFLELQLELIEEWRVRLTQLLSAAATDLSEESFLTADDSPHPLTAVINSAYHTRMVLLQWAHTLHYLQLYYYRRQFQHFTQQQHHDGPEPANSDDTEEGSAEKELDETLSLKDVEVRARKLALNEASRKSSVITIHGDTPEQETIHLIANKPMPTPNLPVLDSDEQESGVFGEAPALLAHLHEAGLTALAVHILLEFKAALRDYKKQKWHAMTHVEEMSLSVSPALCRPLGGLCARLHAANAKLAPPFSVKLRSHVTAEVDQYLFELFLESKFRTLELITPLVQFHGRDKTIRERSFHIATTTSINESSTTKVCPMCKEEHTMSHCKQFSKMDPAQRSEFVKSHSLCFNCLLPGHPSRRCRLSMSCRICNRRHHSLLHQTNNATHTNASDSNVQAHHSNLEDKMKNDSNDDVTVSSHFTSRMSTALLATALVNVKDITGKLITLRALVDPGSQATFMSERAAQLLRIEKRPINGTVTGVGSTVTIINHVVQVEVSSRYDVTLNLPIEAYIMSTRLTTTLPSKAITTCTWPHIQKLVLADPSYNQPGRVDMLLGVEVCSQIWKSEIIKGPPGTPCAQSTSLGWILFGKVDECKSPDESIIVMHHNLNLDNMLKSMWEIEESSNHIRTPEERLCEDIYQTTHSRTNEGRYTVKLPFKSKELKCTEGKTRDIALKRLQYLEKRFERNDNLRIEYNKVIEEYKEFKYIEEVPEKEINNTSVYLPHHAVIRDDKETTKLRVVFDASCKGSNNVSLNDELLVGPPLQEDMRALILRWRTKQVGYMADVQKMYLQVLVAAEDRDYQRILWRSDGEIKDYRLPRVTFGTASAPYLAVRTLHQIAEDEGKDNPTASKTIKEDFYMDDLMSGANTVEEAMQTAKDVMSILQRGGFNLQKWSSNSAEFLQQIEPAQRSSHVSIDLKIDGTIKALGLSWNMGLDAFQYNITLPTKPDTCTKRNVLADVQRLFDPLGWLAPAIVPAKILIQGLWLKGVAWDEEVDAELHQEWRDLRESLKQLDEIQLHRWMYTTQANLNNATLHGFSDASTKAYAAVAYLRVETKGGEIKTSLVAARTRVAPVKSLTVPRLELCGAVLLSRLIKQVREALRIPKENVHAWTDSTIVLSWLSGDPTRWNVFVKNRVTEIQDNTSNQWYQVSSQDNPADVASRGISVQDLKNCDIWWNGPRWLKNAEIKYNKPNLEATDLERRITIQSNLKINEEETNIYGQFENFETLQELVKTITFCKRFIRSRMEKNTEANITTEEYTQSLKSCVKLAQREAFGEEITALKQERQVRQDSTIKDDDNILRVGGRLRHADLKEERKHPIILNNKCQLTTLIVADAHLQTLHGGVQLMLAFLRAKYWIIRAKGTVKAHIRRCLICAKQNATARTQVMGDLPKERVNPSRPFLHSGVDFTGPFTVLFSKGRGAKTSKAYICIFICMSTKAIHLELVGDMTSEAFIAAFRRFVARRGKCAHMWSDQGRNFVGANKELVAEWNEAKLEFNNEIAQTLAVDGTQWHFIPAYSPNFGGLWEAGVKSIKYHLKRILTTNLTYEEMSTILCQVEACLNSRPLCPIDDSDIDNIETLTPGHFLIGEAPITVPSPDLPNTKTSRLSRWQYMQRLLRNFWQVWQQEYLSRLQQRPKWLNREKEFKIGSIVLIKCDNLPPGKWSLGRVLAKHPGADGLTRVYSVKSGESVTKRCVSKLCPLPIEIETNDEIEV